MILKRLPTIDVNPSTIFLVFVASTLTAVSLPFALAPTSLTGTEIAAIVMGAWLLPLYVLVAFRTPQLGGRRRALSEEEKRPAVMVPLVFGTAVIVSSVIAWIAWDYAFLGICGIYIGMPIALSAVWMAHFPETESEDRK